MWGVRRSLSQAQQSVGRVLRPDTLAASRFILQPSSFRLQEGGSGQTRLRPRPNSSDCPWSNEKPPSGRFHACGPRRGGKQAGAPPKKPGAGPSPRPVGPVTSKKNPRRVEARSTGYQPVPTVRATRSPAGRPVPNVADPSWHPTGLVTSAWSAGSTPATPIHVRAQSARPSARTVFALSA